MTKRLPRPADLPEPSREARRRALHVLSLMRVDGLSFTRALRKAHTTRETVLRYVGHVLRRTESGRYRAKPWDRLPRVMQFYTRDGKIPLEVRDSRSASRVSAYVGAVDEFLKTGDEDVLRPFRGQDGNG